MTCKASRVGKKAAPENRRESGNFHRASSLSMISRGVELVTNAKDNAGSGIDQPEPRNLLERIGDGVKSVIPKKSEPKLPGTTDPSATEPPAV
jgi:hypothetical protein